MITAQVMGTFRSTRLAYDSNDPVLNQSIEKVRLESHRSEVKERNGDNLIRNHTIIAECLYEHF